jgi:hypothetical protein
VFQSARVGVTKKMKENVILFLMGIDCFAYWTNLVVLVYQSWVELLNWRPSFRFHMGLSFIHLKNSLNFRAYVISCLQRKIFFVETRENKMDYHVSSYETCDGAILAFDCKYSWWCFEKQHY